MTEGTTNADYTRFFGLSDKPFKLKPDPRFFYTNPSYESAYNTILGSIREYKGLVVLTGKAGTGKTALLRRCMINQDGDVQFILVSNASLSFKHILDDICQDLKLEVKDGEYFNKTQILT